MSVEESGSPSFPSWLLKRDETLSGARTNALFLAFEERRLRGSGFFSEMRHHPTSAAIGLIPIGGLALLIVMTILMPPGFCCWFAVFTFGTWAAMSMIRGRRSEAQFVPSEISKVLGRSVYSAVLQDLWLTPSRGRDFAEAMVLEARRGSHNATMICVGLPLIACVASIVLFAIMDHETIRVGDGTLIAAFIAFACSMAQPIYWVFGMGAVSDTAALFDFAHTKKPLRLAGANALSSLGEMLAYFLAVALVAAVAVGLAMVFDALLLDPITQYTQEMKKEGSLGRLVYEVASGNLPQIMLALLFLLLILPAHFASWWLKSEYLKKMNRLNDNADEALPRIVEFTLNES